MGKTKIRIVVGIVVGIVVLLMLLVGGYFLFGDFGENGFSWDDRNFSRKMNSSVVNSSLMELCRDDSTLSECVDIRDKIKGGMR